MTRWISAVLLALAAHAYVRAVPPTIIPFDEVRAGMKGEGRTAFRGSTVETFQVEVLGTLRDVGPDQDLILVRCAGGPLAETGVIAGMSGSPVFLEGRLAGAVAYSWGFSKDAIAGVTPIEEMLAIGGRERPRPSTPPRTGDASGRPALARLFDPAGLESFLTADLPRMLPRPAAAAPLALPLSISGLSPAALGRAAQGFARAGFLPVQAGRAGAPAGEPAPMLEPGSPVGIKLVRGDVDMTATGTVTWVDGDQVLAFGHPLYGLGAVDLPLAAARVEALLPSYERSAKIASSLDERGAFRQDRAPGLLGRLGARSRMIPVRLQLIGGDGTETTYAFDIASDPLLAPFLLYTSLNGVLESRERMYGNLTLRLRDGSVIKLDGLDDVRLDNVFAGSTAPAYATGLSAYILYLLMNNEWQTPSVAGINLILEHRDEPRTAVIRRVTLDRYRVRPGESVQATIVVSPFRGADLVLSRRIEIPHETPSGRLLLQVGDAGALNRADSADDPVLPRDLEQMIRLINRLRRNDRVHIVAWRSDSGVFLGGSRLPNLPPSALTVLTRPRSTGNHAVLPQRGVLEDEIPTEYAIEGFARVQVEVDAP